MRRRVPRPLIPPTPQIASTDEAADRMAELVKARQRRGRWLTRQTKHAIAQNHFAYNIKKAMEV